MPRIIGSLAAVVALPFVAFPSPQTSHSPGSFTLAGVVVREGTNQPLNHVLVTISYTQRRKVRLSYITDTDGRFIFPNLSAGKWDISAEKNGYVLETYQNSDEGYSTAVAVGPGIDTIHITFPLHPNTILTGTVLDDQGDPVRQAQVLLFRTGVTSGKLATQNLGQQRTDAAGQFSFESLRTGTYYVAVSARPWYAQNYYAAHGQTIHSDSQVESDAVEHGDRDVAYPITYYGDTTDAASAQPIAIEDGNEAQVRITLHTVPAWHLTLRDPAAPNEQSNPQTDQPTAPVQLRRMRMRQGVSISVTGPGGFPIEFPVAASYTGEGEQQIFGVPSGRYTIELVGQSTSFRQIVDVNGDQVLDVAVKPPISLSGHVTWQGAEQGKAPSESAYVYLATEGRFTITAPAQISKDGLFTFDQNPPPPGKYRLEVRGGPGFVIQSVQAKGARYENGWLDLTGEEPAQLSIVVISGLGKIDGIALRDGKPCPAAMVLLLPSDGNPDAIRRDQSDSDGTFTLPDVLSGRYTLLAIDNGRDLAYQDPDVMAKYLPKSKTVEFPLKDKAQVAIEVQPRLP